jgi:hypothetical protein
LRRWMMRRMACTVKRSPPRHRMLSDSMSTSATSPHWNATAAKNRAPASPCVTCAAMQTKEANRDVWAFGWEMSSRGRFTTPADFPRHDCSPYSHVHARTRKFEICSSFKGHFLSPRAKP